MFVTLYIHIIWSDDLFAVVYTETLAVIRILTYTVNGW